MKTARVIITIGMVWLAVAVGGCASETEPVGTKQGLVIVASDSTDIVATYRANDVDLVLLAHVAGDRIESQVLLSNGELLTRLTVPNSPDTQLPEIQQLIEAAAVEAAPRFAAMPVAKLEFMRWVYNDAMNQLNEATRSLAGGQFHYALPYHSAIVSLIQHDDTRAYVASGDSEVCAEHGSDPNIPFHYASQHGASEPVSSPDGDNPPTLYNRCLLGAGSSHGCCGNYSGCCYYWHPACWAHDELCSRCGSWLCGWQCKPDAQ